VTGLKNNNNTGLNWMNKFIVSTQEAEKYDNPKFLYKNLVIQGHVSVLVSPPNGGKTSIAMFIAKILAAMGLLVNYVNADIAQSDAKSMVEYAKKNDFTLLLPDMKAGLSMQDVVDNLITTNNEGGDFSNYVFIFDTLKKMTDVINKSLSKQLYKLLRSLSAKGMTIILLAHTNKYNDANGKPIFEGTSDLRSDVDELIYLIPKKNNDASMTVSTEPDKTRGKFKPISFKITPDREVIPLDDFIDVADINQKEQQREEDSPIIDLITEAIKAEIFIESKINNYIKDKDTGFGRRKIGNVLQRYKGELWIVQPTCSNNAKQYFLIEDDNDINCTPIQSAKS